MDKNLEVRDEACRLPEPPPSFLMTLACSTTPASTILVMNLEAAAPATVLWAAIPEHWVAPSLAPSLAPYLASCLALYLAPYLEWYSVRSYGLRIRHWVRAELIFRAGYGPRVPLRSVHPRYGLS